MVAKTASNLATVRIAKRENGVNSADGLGRLLPTESGDLVSAWHHLLAPGKHTSGV